MSKATTTSATKDHTVIASFKAKGSSLEIDTVMLQIRDLRIKIKAADEAGRKKLRPTEKELIAKRTELGKASINKRNLKTAWGAGMSKEREKAARAALSSK